MSIEISCNEAAHRLQQAKRLVITAHINPDGDALGSALGLQELLHQQGKEALVLIDDDLPKNFSFLPGYDQVQRPEQPHYEADLLVVLDASLDRIGSVREKCPAPVLNIDHHVSNDGAADWLYLDARAAATAELIFRLGCEMEVPFSAAAAEVLYTGMATDCGFFRYANTTAFTMRAAADLLEHGVKPNRISEALEQKSYARVKGRLKALETMELCADGRIGGLFLDRETADGLETTEGLIDSVRIIEGVDVAVLVKCIDDGLCRVSMRSKKTDVSRIAMALQGGGHIRAAGCTIHSPLPEAKKIILAAITAALEEQA